jgi:hypothetical protein
MGGLWKVVRATYPLMLAGLLFGCGDSDEGGASGVPPTGGVTVISYSGTSGTNDQWTVVQTPESDTANSGQFTVENPFASYTGTYTQVPSGLTKFVCTDASGCIGYSFQITDGVLAMWFSHPTTLPIIAMVKGTCPAADTPAVHNFVRLPNVQEQQAGWYATSEGSGRSRMTQLSSLINFETTPVTFEPVIKTPVVETAYSCQDGIISHGTGANAVQVHVTDSGFIVRTDGAIGGGFMGVAEPNTSYADLPVILSQKEFIGLQWNNKLGTVVGLKARYVTPGSSASYDEGKKALPCVGNALGCMFARYMDLDTGEPYGKPYMKTFMSEVSDSSTTPATPYYGLFTTQDDDTDGAIAMKDLVGKYVLLEAAKLSATGPNPGDAYNSIMVEN